MRDWLALRYENASLGSSPTVVCGERYSVNNVNGLGIHFKAGSSTLTTAMHRVARFHQARPSAEACEIRRQSVYHRGRESDQSHVIKIETDFQMSQC